MVPNAQPFVPNTACFGRGTGGSVLGSHQLWKKKLQKSEDESWLFRQFLVFGPSVFGGIFTINMGSHEFPGPFPSRFVDQQKFAACRPATFGSPWKQRPSRWEPKTVGNLVSVWPWLLYLTSTNRSWRHQEKSGWMRERSRCYFSKRVGILFKIGIQKSRHPSESFDPVDIHQCAFSVCSDFF